MKNTTRRRLAILSMLAGAAPALVIVACLMYAVVTPTFSAPCPDVIVGATLALVPCGIAGAVLSSYIDYE